MGISTHLGPWLLGTVKETTGTTAGTVRNTGASVVTQSKTIAYGDTAASAFAALPAGAQVLSFTLIQTTKFTSGTAGTVTVLLNGVAMAVVTITGAGASGLIAPVSTSDAQSVMFNNIGTTDGLLTYTTSTLTAGAGSLIVEYTVRNADGTSAPAAA